jgi:hypothetical protein
MEPQKPNDLSHLPHAAASPPLEKQPGTDRISTFVDEAKSIQALLQSYQQKTACLKQDLSGFVHREVDEHTRLLHLRAAVDKAELTALRDTKYVEYVTTHAKSQQSQSESSTPFDSGVSSHILKVPHESAPECIQNYSVSEKSIWWEDKLKRHRTTWARRWRPDMVLSLEGEEDVVHVWLGWRTANKTTTVAFERMVERIYAPEEAERGDATRELTCFGNGFLYTAAAETDIGTLANLQEKARSIVVVADHLSHSEDGGHCFDRLARRTAWVASLYNAELCHAAAMPLERFVERMWPRRDLMATDELSNPSIGSGLRLCGDGRDTLVFVDPKRLQRTVTVRGFFFNGVVGLVEQLGVEVDITTLLLPPDQSPSKAKDYRLRTRSCILRTLCTLYAAIISPSSDDESVSCTSTPANMVLTVALEFPALKNGLFDGVLLDARTLSPQLPFEGRTTWMEVCAMGRQQDNLRRCEENSGEANEASALLKAAEENVVFRLAYLSVASLQPYDVISTQVFPLLNAAMGSQMVVPGVTAGSTKDTVRALPVSFTAMASVCLCAASCVALVVTVARWVRR